MNFLINKIGKCIFSDLVNSKKTCTSPSLARAPTGLLSIHVHYTKHLGWEHFHKTGFIEGFWYFARSWSRKFQVNPRNPAKFARNLTMHNIFESYLGCWGCLLTINLPIYFETSSPQRVNNISKLPGIRRLMLRKTGKQQCKTQAFLA